MKPENNENTESIYTCGLCGRVVVENPVTRGYAKNIARRRLVKLCIMQKCRCDPVYGSRVRIEEPAP